MTKQEYRKLMNAKTKIDDIQFYMHCSHCLQSKPDGISPRDYASYEIGGVPLQIGDGKPTLVVSVFCKRCGKVVWDSRHLRHVEVE